MVLFEEAIEHVTRIARAISQPKGNVLVLGSESVGRKSVSRIAASLTKIPIFEIESGSNYTFDQWRRELKSVLLKTGLEDLELCFLVSETQLVHEKMLEDINDILNGE